MQKQPAPVRALAAQSQMHQAQFSAERSRLRECACEFGCCGHSAGLLVVWRRGHISEHSRLNGCAYRVASVDTLCVCVFVCVCVPFLCVSACLFVECVCVCAFVCVVCVYVCV